MILNNYYYLKAYTARTPLSTSYERSEDIGMRNLSDSIANCYGYASNVRFNADNWALRSYLGVRLGTGTTEPALINYALDDDVTPAFANVETKITTASDGPSLKTIIEFSGRNTSNSLTITEIGITKNIVRAYRNYWDKVDVLMVRELLETPIEVPNNKWIQLTFQWVEE